MTTTNPSLADTEPAPSPGLLAVTVAALQHAGRLVSTDWEMDTFDVSSGRQILPPRGFPRRGVGRVARSTPLRIRMRRLASF